VRLADAEGWSIVPAGGGAWLDAGNPLRRADIFLKTARLSSAVEHEPADLVAKARAGVTLARLNAELARAGQWLALDPPDDGRSTVGGVVATGACGAQSVVYGPARSHVLGMTVALADGRLIRVGGRVVKNVAGYDLPKLFVGSFGTLGLILDVTFKLRPLPRVTGTLAAYGEAATLLDAGRALVRERLAPAAVELLNPRAASELLAREHGAALLVRFAGAAEAVAWQSTRARELLTAGGAEGVEAIEDEAQVWTSLQAYDAREGRELAARVNVPPSELGAMIVSLVDEMGADEDGLAWHAGVCVGALRFSAGSVRDGSRAARQLKTLRATARARGGSLVVERAPAQLKREVDAWGVEPARCEIMRRVKSQLDPRDTFSPGRFA
jgi:FAD/FMN-containing dehydrogenase